MSKILRPLFCRLVLSQKFCVKSSQNDSFSVIYRFPGISICSVINKFKKFQVVAAGTAIPGSYAAHWLNLCDGSLPVVVSSVALASTVAVFSIGQLFTDMIGFAYYNKNTQEIKLSYLDFWGKRKDVIYGLEDFLPLTHSPKYVTDFLFRRIYVYSSRSPFKLSIKYGTIVDVSTFKNVFCYDDLDNNFNGSEKP